MRKVSEGLKETLIDYDNRMSMRRKDGGMTMSHEMSMPKDKKKAIALAQEMIAKMFGGK